MTDAKPFVVRVNKPRVTVTYICPTPEWALKKLSDFQAAGHDDISVTRPDEKPLVEADLFAMVEGRENAAHGLTAHRSSRRRLTAHPFHSVGPR